MIESHQRLKYRADAYVMAPVEGDALLGAAELVLSRRLTPPTARRGRPHTVRQVALFARAFAFLLILIAGVGRAFSNGARSFESVEVLGWIVLAASSGTDLVVYGRHRVLNGALLVLSVVMLGMRVARTVG
jgi:hypothetical protein